MNLKKLNPLWWFANDDDTVPPKEYHPEWSKFRRNFYWKYIRNPLHNFTFYVIGVADKVKEGKIKRLGKYPNTVFNPNGGWNFCYSLGAPNYSLIVTALLLIFIYFCKLSVYKSFILTGLTIATIMTLPFVSYIGKFKFYLGWRERGNWGVKLTPNRDNK